MEEESPYSRQAGGPNSKCPCSRTVLYPNTAAAFCFAVSAPSPPVPPTTPWKFLTADGTPYTRHSHTTTHFLVSAYHAAQS